MVLILPHSDNVNNEEAYSKLFFALVISIPLIINSICYIYNLH